MVAPFIGELRWSLAFNELKKFPTSSWVLGVVFLVAAVLAAVLSVETIEDIVARLLGERSDD